MSDDVINFGYNSLYVDFNVFLIFSSSQTKARFKKKVPLTMSKKGHRGWRLEDNGRDQSFVCNLKSEN